MVDFVRLNHIGVFSDCFNVLVLTISSPKCYEKAIRMRRFDLLFARNLSRNSDTGEAMVHRNIEAVLKGLRVVVKFKFSVFSLQKIQEIRHLTLNKSGAV